MSTFRDLSLAVQALHVAALRSALRAMGYPDTAAVRAYIVGEPPAYVAAVALLALAGAGS